MDIKGKYGKIYNIKENEVYLVETNMLMVYAGVVSFIAFVILFIYDYGKDLLRTISGYGNILGGNATKGAIKVMGYTKGNIKREIGLIVLFILAIVFGYFSRQETLLSLSEVPVDIKKQLKKEQVTKPSERK